MSKVANVFCRPSVLFETPALTAKNAIFLALNSDAHLFKIRMTSR